MFKNYCIILIGENKNVIDDIMLISEKLHNTLDGKGMFIATITSIMNPEEIKNFFMLKNRNIIVFDLHEESSSIFFQNKKVFDSLFSFKETYNDTFLEKMTNDFDSHNAIDNVKVDYSDLSSDEKMKIWDEIIDKGVENLTDRDKEILKKITE